MAEIDETKSEEVPKPSTTENPRRSDLKISRDRKTESDEEPEIEVPTEIDPLGREREFVKAKDIKAAQHWDARIWRRLS